jgi:chaperone protein DnaJ
MAEKKDYYNVLGVDKTATDDEIKSAFRTLAKKYHPDNKETGDAEKFKECTEAYSVLSDPEKRKTYDQFGSAAFDQTAGGSNPFSGSGFEGFNFNGGDFGDLNDILNSMFGFGGGSSSRSRTRNGSSRGEDTMMRIKISFVDAALGTTISLPITYDEQCEHCHGTGAKDGTAYEKCPDCGGQGVVLTQQRSIFGIIQSQMACPRCHGTGRIIRETCPYCNGNGYTRVKKTIDVKIPAGINNGQQIRVAGKGNRGSNGGNNGDLYLEIIVSSHDNFEREGNDIHLTVPIDFIDICLGVTLTIPTLYGDVEMKIPAGTQPNQVFKIKNKGVKDVRGSNYGDEFVHLNVKTPTNLNRDQKDALEKFKAASNSNESWFNKFKKAFKK